MICYTGRVTLTVIDQDLKENVGSSLYGKDEVHWISENENGKVLFIKFYTTMVNIF